jgi:cysteine desulfurase
MSMLAARRQDIEGIVLAHVPGAVIAGCAAQRLPNTVCFTWPGKSAETLLIRLDLEGVAMSSGAACSSGKIGPSHVLSAMGFTDAEARSALRISIGLDTREEEIARLARAIAIIAGPSVGQPMTIINTPGADRSRLETIMGEG